MDCYGKHLDEGVCQRKKKCELCEVTWDTKKDKHHTCERYTCSTCGVHYTKTNQPHMCYMEPKMEDKLVEEDSLPKAILSFDIESTQENGDHRPMLLISKVSCDNCFGKAVKCRTCEEKIFFDYSCVKEFGHYLFVELANNVPRNTVIYAFAHNARGYDAHFVLRELWNMYLDKFDVTMSGRKILRIKCGNVRLLDSLSFFLQPLATLPKAFGLDISIKKGDFPHHFNVPENWSYVGKIPDIEFYKPEMKKFKDAEQLRKWHAEKSSDSSYVFDFKKELVAYCRNDVDILDQCINTFRYQFQAITNLDPITRCFTLASIGLEVFKALYLTPALLGITKTDPYNPREDSRCSINEVVWLDWLEQNENRKITRQYQVGKYYADGFEQESNTIYEFLGCHFHDCMCRKDRDVPIPSLNGRTYSQLYDKLMKKFLLYKKLKYNVRFIWECEFHRERRSDPSMRQYTGDQQNFIKFLREQGGARIKEAFFGGRTNNLKFYYTCTEQETIKYVDFCSLYPYVLSSKIYPVKHPELITYNFDYTLKSYFGFIKCKVLPPRGLYLPVLPMKINKKLLFPLCYACARYSYDTCEHCPDERSLVNTWTSVELLKAIEKGYIISEIYEVLHYPFTKDDLFSPYVYMWVKIKQQASGWPTSCKSEADKQNYLMSYKEKYDIDFDTDKIEINPALRFIAKILLNSFWGKLAQRPNLPRTEFINSYDHYLALERDADKEILSDLMVNEDLMLLNWHFVEDYKSKPKNYLASIAAFVTAYARLELYDKMDLIEANSPGSLLYHDTDSIIYVQQEGEKSVVECGEFLGELTDEIIKEYGEGSRCVKFCALGPKNYGYEVLKPNGEISSTFKVKGISLNEKTLNMVNFEKMFEMASGYNEGKRICLDVPQMQITASRNHQIYTRYFDKKYQAVSTKRYIKGDNLTLPYGY